MLTRLSRTALSVTLVGAMAAACRADHTSTAGGELASSSFDVGRADSALTAAHADASAWASYGRDFTNQRWSPLTQINTGNVGQLQLAWVHHSHVPHASETNPVVVDTVMYFSTALNHVFAVDARTGQTLWEYAYDYGGHTVVDCCSTNNKGVTVYGGRVYMGTLDARLVALDASTGKLLWKTQVADNDLGYHMTGAPLAVEGRVITGVSGGEQGCRCFVDAYDASSGKRLWRWYTIPSPAEGGWWGKWRQADDWGMSFNRDIAQEKADSARYADAWQHGGGPMWHHPAYDPATHTVFLNIGNPAPDNDGDVRPGDNLYTSSIVALDARTGKLKWYFQEVSHDVWDYDATTPPVLVDLPDEHGQMVHAVAEVGKDGFAYVLDRATGRPIRKSDPIVPFMNYMTQPDTQGVVIAPGTLGGSDWSPTAFSPQTGYMYVDASNLPMKYWKKHEELKPPAQWWGGTVAAGPKGNYGFVEAVDLRTGHVAWKDQLPQPMIGGLLATAGGVVFTGSSDKHVFAYDARTGKQLWSFATDAAVNAPPITYALDGVQYVAVAATGLQTLDTPRGDEMLVFALPRVPGATGAAIGNATGVAGPSTPDSTRGDTSVYRTLRRPSPGDSGAPRGTGGAARTRADSTPPSTLRPGRPPTGNVSAKPGDSARAGRSPAGTSRGARTTSDSAKRRKP